MSSWKDNLVVEKETVKLSVEQSSLSFFEFIRRFPRWKKVLFLIIIIGLVPAIILARVGTQLLAEKRLASGVLTAHSSHIAPRAVKVGEAKVLTMGQGTYSAYAEITNENLDLSAGNVPYRFVFYNSSGRQITSIPDSTYMLPDQEKYLVVPRITSAEPIASAKLMIDTFQWQKRLSLPEVVLRASAPFLSNEQDPLTLVAEGAVVNNSAYDLGTVRLIFLLYDHSNTIVAVSQRDEFTLPAFGRRAYKQTWPGLNAANIARAVVLPETNTLDNDNLISAQ